jgi:RHS repeat-associated protein
LGERLYAEVDANCSIVSLDNVTGNVIQRTTFTPYGGVAFFSTSWSPSSDTYHQDILYEGGRLESATGQYIFQERDYDPSTGIWKEQDPQGYADSLNVYQFELDNALTNLDPFGTWAITRVVNDRRAMVRACPTDTVQGLLGVPGVSFQADEYKKWLKSEDGKPLPPSLTAQMGESRFFSVPNVVYVTEGDIKNPPPGRFGFRKQVFPYLDWVWTTNTMHEYENTLIAQRYFVVEDSYTNRANMQKYVSDPDIAGLAFFGHGDPDDGDLVVGEPQFGNPGQVDLRMVSADILVPQLNHRLSLLYLYSCFAGRNLSYDYTGADGIKPGHGWDQMVAQPDGTLEVTDQDVSPLWDSWDDIPIVKRIK